MMVAAETVFVINSTLHEGKAAATRQGLSPRSPASFRIQPWAGSPILAAGRTIIRRADCASPQKGPVEITYGHAPGFGGARRACQCRAPGKLAGIHLTPVVGN